jgi:hypothetical protein
VRELTKSIASFSWALSLFGLEQMSKMLIPQAARSSAPSLDTVTQSTRQQLGPSMRSAFQAGDNLQRGVIDMMFSLFNPSSWTPGGMMGAMRTGADTAWRAAQTASESAGCGCSGSSQQTSGGWGPMPSSSS